jgi:hypothetical protein
MTLLADAAARLQRAQIPCALIGAAAMAVHGISRATFDIDLLTLDPRVLDATFWTPFHGTVDTTRGAADDPLAGIVRITRPPERDVDLVVGQSAWQRELLSRAREVEIDGVPLPVVDVAGLVLLKLFAAGAQDAWDVQQLLALGDGERILADVEKSLRALPLRSRALWARVRDAS